MMNQETNILPVITSDWSQIDPDPNYRSPTLPPDIDPEIRDRRLVTELQEKAAAWLRLSERTQNPKFKAEYIAEYEDILAAINRRIPPANFNVVKPRSIITPGWTQETSQPVIRPLFDTDKANRLIAEKHIPLHPVANFGLRAMAWMRSLGILNTNS